MRHPQSSTSAETIATGNVPSDKLAKSVLAKTNGMWVLVVVPSLHHVRLRSLRKRFGRAFSLASESETKELFPDCEAGSISPLGDAYGIKVLVDDSLLQLDDVYFEAGDHTALVHVSGGDFRTLMVQAEHGQFMSGAGWYGSK